MPPESELDEVVLFEVPPELADNLLLRLQRPRLGLQQPRLAWLIRTHDGLFIASALRVELDDLARLLRDVQDWLADVQLPFLTFLLDGREYELREPAEPLVGRNA